MVHPLDIPEIALHVSAFLPVKDLSACILVSRQWHRAFQVSLWKTVSWKMLEHNSLQGPTIDSLEKHRYFIYRLCLLNLSPTMSETIQTIDFPHLRSLRISCTPHEGQIDGDGALGSRFTVAFLRRHRHSLQELTLGFDDLGTADPKEQPTPSQTQLIGTLALATLDGNQDQDNDEEQKEEGEGRGPGGTDREVRPPQQLLKSLILKDARINLEEMDARQGLWGMIRELHSLAINNWICTPIDISSFPSLGTWVNPSVPTELSSFSPLPSSTTTAIGFSNMEGTKLRHLCLQGGNITTCLHEVALIHHCQALQSLTWHNDQLKISPHSILSRFRVEGQWPLLNSLDLGIPGLDGQGLETIIESLNRPLQKLALNCHVSFIVHACEALLHSGDGRHRKSLEILHLPYAKDVAGPLIHEILCSFAHLKSFHIVGGIRNADFSKDKEDDPNAFMPQPWACQGLQDFRMNLFPNLTPRLMRFYEHLSGNGDEHWNEPAEQFRIMLARLEALPKLEILMMGQRSCSNLREPHCTFRQTHFKSTGWKIRWSQDNILPISTKSCGWGRVYDGPGR